MASGLDIWGAIASVIGVLSVIQVIWSIVHGRLPNQCIRLFEQTLTETEALLSSVSEEGLFNDNGHYVTHAKTRISNICKRLDGLREESFEAKTYKQELKQWWGGLSRRISVCNMELKGLRAEISVTSSKAREALTRQRLGGNNETPSLESESQNIIVCDSAHDGQSCDSGTTQGYSSMEGGTEVSIPSSERVQWRPVSADQCEDHLVVATPSNADASKTSVIGRAQCSLHDPPQNPVRSDSAETLPSYQRQSVPRRYSPSLSLLCPSQSDSSVIRTTTLLCRCTAPDSARATRKLIKAYRRSLMMHNVPWTSYEPLAQHYYHGVSAAASARGIDRPSNNRRHWKLLEERSRTRLRSYVAVLSHEASLVAFPRSAGPVQA